jgi:probable phosphoglycerate mutase
MISNAARQPGRSIIALMGASSDANCFPRSSSSTMIKMSDAGLPHSSPNTGAYTRLTVTRHGETEWNREGRYMNHLDSPLTELGISQAKALAARFANSKFDAVYSSDLGRAVATAKIITDCCSGEATQIPDLREHALGFFQGLTLREIDEKFPAMRAKVHEDPDFEVPGGGESGRAFHARVVRGFEGIVARHRGGEILVVGHGGVLETLIRHAMKIPLDAPRPARVANCSVNVFDVYEDHWVLCTWGDVSHLG